MPADVTIRLLTDTDLPAYKALRDVGLQRDPEAFTSDFDSASALPPATYATRLGQPPDDHFILGAFDASGAMLGAVVCERQARLKKRHEAELVNGPNERTLQLSCIPGLASNWLLARLADFRQRHPEIQLVLRPSDTAPDFTRRDMDGDIRYVIDAAPDKPPAGEVETVQLGRPPVLAVASPARLEALGDLRTPADLLKGPLLHEENSRQWTAWFEANGVTPDQELAGHRH